MGQHINLLPLCLLHPQPSSYPIARFRRRSIEARGVTVSYKPHPGETLGGAPAAAAAGGGDSSSSGSGGNTDALPPRSPSDSYLEVILPFATSPNLRDEVRPGWRG